MDKASEKISKRLKTLLVLGGTVLFFSAFSSASAASLYFSPSAPTRTAGEVFSVGIFVSSTDQSINAVSGAVTVSDNLTITGVSNGNLVSFWARQSQSFPAKSVQFDGVIINGYQGNAGKILTLHLKGSSTGRGTLTFTSGKVLANDGKGTDVTAGLGSAGVALVKADIALPPAPVVTSPTHPDENVWYANPQAVFQWIVPVDVKEVSFTADGNPDTVPDSSAATVISETVIPSVNSGIYYFHVRFKNNKEWGPVTHYKYLVDIDPPEPFAVLFPYGNKTYCPRSHVYFETTDRHSGVNYFEVMIDDQEPVIVYPRDVSTTDPHMLQLQAPGKHSVKVHAVDAAGNQTEAIGEYRVQQPQEWLINTLIGVIVILLIILLYIALRFIKLKRDYEAQD